MAAARRRAILRVAARVPRGRVATYGQVARLAGYPGNARLVGMILRVLPADSDVPWHRIVNSQGRISPRGEPIAEDIQAQMLRAEGVVFSPSGTLRLRDVQWRPELE